MEKFTPEQLQLFKAHTEKTMITAAGTFLSLLTLMQGHPETALFIATSTLPTAILNAADLKHLKP